jgi:hypothetical protein
MQAASAVSAQCHRLLLDCTDRRDQPYFHRTHDPRCAVRWSALAPAWLSRYSQRSRLALSCASDLRGAPPVQSIRSAPALMLGFAHARRQRVLLDSRIAAGSAASSASPGTIASGRRRYAAAAGADDFPTGPCPAAAGGARRGAAPASRDTRPDIPADRPFGDQSLRDDIVTKVRS